EGGLSGRELHTDSICRRVDRSQARKTSAEAKGQTSSARDVKGTSSRTGRVDQASNSVRDGTSRLDVDRSDVSALEVDGPSSNRRWCSLSYTAVSNSIGVRVDVRIRSRDIRTIGDRERSTRSGTK